MKITRKQLRDKKIEFSREQISIRAIEIAKMCAEGSYKNAIACIGRMCALEKTIDDGYWREKLNHGFSLESYYLNSGMRDDHPDKSIDVN